MATGDCMQRIGIIERLMPHQKAMVRLVRHTACEKCGACHLGDANKNITMVAMNDIGAVTGDKVTIEMPTGGVLKAAFIMYMIPLLSLFIGVGLSLLFQVREEIAVLIGLVAAAFAFIGVSLFEPRYRKNSIYQAKIVSVDHVVSQIEDLR